MTSKYGEGTTFSFIIEDKDGDKFKKMRSQNHEVIKPDMGQTISIMINIPEKEEDFLDEKIDENNPFFQHSLQSFPYATQFFRRHREPRLTFPLSSVKTTISTYEEKN